MQTTPRAPRARIALALPILLVAVALGAALALPPTTVAHRAVTVRVRPGHGRNASVPGARGLVRMVWSRALTARAAAGDAAGPRRRDVHAESGRRHPGDRRCHRRPAVGASPGRARRHRRLRLQHPLGENNRNLAIYGSLIIDTSADDHIFALEAETGELAWETKILDYRKNPATQTSGPIIANGMAISGRSCMPAGGPDGCVIPGFSAPFACWRQAP